MTRKNAYRPEALSPNWEPRLTPRMFQECAGCTEYALVQLQSRLGLERRRARVQVRYYGPSCIDRMPEHLRAQCQAIVSEFAMGLRT